MHSFCSILIQLWSFQFWRVKNWSKFERKIFPSHICPKLGSYWQKTCSWCLWDFKFGTQANYLMLKKNPQSYFFFHRGQEHCENGIWNIQIFFMIFSKRKIFDAVLRLVFNSSPLFYSHPASRLLELQLTFCKFSCCTGLCSTRTQIFFKSETVQLAISKYFCLK